MKNEKGFGLIEGLLLAVVVIGLSVGGWYAYNQNQSNVAPIVTEIQTTENEYDIALDDINPDSDVDIVNNESKWLTDYYLEFCENQVAKDYDVAIQKDGFSILPFSDASALSDCSKNTQGQNDYHLLDENIAAYVYYTDNEFVESFSGAPSDETWTVTMEDNGNQGYTLSLKSVDDSKHKSCDIDPNTQVCSGGYKINVYVENPPYQNVIIGLVSYDDKTKSNPDLESYRRVLNSIVIPKK